MIILKVYKLIFNIREAYKGKFAEGLQSILEAKHPSINLFFRMVYDSLFES
jgi:hypothetical protein